MARGIPTGRSTFLLFSECLDDVCFVETVEKPSNEIVKPSPGRFPATELVVPAWMVAMDALKKNSILGRVWQPHHQALAFSASKDDGNIFLPPNLSKLCVIENQLLRSFNRAQFMTISRLL
ncbi:hypothetical protein [Oleiharenicola lentus]|uniref:hypothetical protein n=1 Tax=Oleiharenicola lentus TaxID=2508720 RepID=UPI003F67892B